MQRLKDKELDPSKLHFSDVLLTSSYPKKAANEISMTKPVVVRKIRAEELESPEARKNAVVCGMAGIYNHIMTLISAPSLNRLTTDL